MGTKALIILGGGGQGREAVEILPSLDPEWEKTYLATLDNVWWYERHPVDGPLYLVPRLLPSPGRSLPGKVLSLIRTIFAIIGVLRRTKPDVILGICSDLSIPVMAVARCFGCRTYFVESLTRVHQPSRTSRLLERLRLVDTVFVQHASLTPTLARGAHVGGIL